MRCPSLGSEVAITACSLRKRELKEACPPAVCLMYRGLIHDESSCKMPY